MAKTIQVRVDDALKISADDLFSSLGLDTSTAIRMFLMAALEMGGIPFAVTRGVNQDSVIEEAIKRRKAGATFITADESLANMRSAIKDGIDHE